ncbi:MAG: aminopeptidase P family protein [Candidatus Omnitrophica bacterium]|nr:aminopeptidase P family protein [Candidatus Omnitrophota bacterium]
MNNRLKRLVNEFPRYRNIDALIITQDVNIYYLTDFPTSESWLLVTPQKVFYITDFRYIQEAREGLKGIALIKQQTQCLAATLFELAKTYKIKRLGFDERHTSVACLKKLKGYCPRRTKLVPANGVVESLREVKDEGEITIIRQCLEVHAKALEMLKKVVKPGQTERQVLSFLEGFIKKEGVKFSFSPIIASGPNSAYPHAKVGDRILKNNEPLLIDIGIDIKGYKSDLTRNFFLGRMTPRYKQVFVATALAQKEAIGLIKPGVKVADVDTHARKVLRRFGLARYFGHSLGHGVGLEIHENPRLSVKSPAILEEGMIVTVEPGVYIPGQFGVRVEDMVLVTKQGCEVLSGNYY